MSKNNRILLPKSVSPNHYSLSLVANMTAFTYTGHVKIALAVAAPVQKIKLHAAHLTFRKIVLRQDDAPQQAVDVGSVVFDKEEETAEFPAKIERGKADLEIEFAGSINDQMRGFYRSTFEDSAGKKVVGCTQFEATDARWAFPCWDEPAFKAKFDLDVTVPKKYLVLSNMPVKEEQKAGKVGDKKVVFDTTPTMSTYLLAWFVGEYKGKTVRTENNVDVSIYTPPEKLEKGDWALSVAEKTLTFFEKYFDKRYPLPKLDMLAISDFVNGAMENWGLVTYRDSAIYSDARSSTRAKEWVTAVVAHELAHQWFGNLVTMEWWSQLWLNEGFATFMQVLANDRTFPEFKVWDSFVDDKLDAALRLDSLESSHPIEVEILRAKEINEVFDVISYKKGASVLRMLYEYLGDEHFRKGVSAYLHRHEYKNVDSDALWSSLGESSGKDVAAFMHGFTRKQGYPVVEIEETSRSGTERTFKLTQSRFLLNKASEKAAAQDATVWNIPIRVAAGGAPRWVFMEAKEMQVTVPVEGDVVLFNSGATGFFRTLHKGELMGALGKAIREMTISASDRFKVLSDVKAFFVAGKVSAEQFLCLLESFKAETDEIVWKGVFAAINSTRAILRGRDAEKTLNRLSNALTDGIAGALGFVRGAEDSMGRQKLRADVLSQRALCEHAETLDFYNAQFKERAETPEAIDSNIFGSVLSNAVKHGGTEELGKVQRLAETLKDPSRKNQALYAVGAGKSQGLLAKALQYCTSDRVRRQDSFIVFSSVACNRHGTKSAWAFFKENYEFLRETYTHNSLFSRFVAVTGGLDSDELIADAEAFFAGRNTEGYEKMLRQSLESAKMQVALKKRELARVERWLREKKY